MNRMQYLCKTHRQPCKVCQVIALAAFSRDYRHSTVPQIHGSGEGFHASRFATTASGGSLHARLRCHRLLQVGPRQQSSAHILKPINVVFITLDTVRADHLHCYGYDKIKTPAIDALAANGVLFEKAVAQTPLTGPSHASMFTGTNPNVHHVRDNGFALQPASTTLTTILEKQGWNTGGFVSTTILGKHFGFSQGFTAYDDQMPLTSSGRDAASRPANVRDRSCDYMAARAACEAVLFMGTSLRRPQTVSAARAISGGVSRRSV